MPLHHFPHNAHTIAHKKHNQTFFIPQPKKLPKVKRDTNDI